MPLTGYNANTIGSFITGAGVLAQAGALLGVSRGGFTVDTGQTVESVQVDGMPGTIIGLERPTAYAPRMTGTLLQADNASLALYGLGTGVASGTAPNTETTFTPPQVNTFLPQASYQRWVELITQRGDGEFVVYVFPWARIIMTSMKTVDLKEAEFSVTVSARTALTGNVSTDTLVAPFFTKVRNTIFESTYAP